MCGILGGFGKKTRQFSEEKWRESLHTLHHRGPDAKGLDQGSFYCLGHTRLSIQDLSTGANQPFQDDQYSLVYNGEIYNHFDLRKALPHYQYKTNSDTETLFWGLITKGPDFLNDCLGMFAGAFLDKKTQKLLLFRDKFGVKPLYLHQSDSSLFFASEIKAFWALGVTTPTVNRNVLNCYLGFENYPQEFSLFHGIDMLEPGSVWTVTFGLDEQLVIHKTSLRTARFCEADLDSTQNPVEVGRRIIEDAVKSHLLSDVPLAVYLSGGIDSSLVASIASRECGGLNGFTGYFENLGEYYDERPYARLVAQQSNIKLEEVAIGHQDLEKHFDQVIRALDEPRMGMGSFSQNMVATKVAQDHKVVLTGHGGDEIFCGYPIFKAFWIHQNLYHPKKLFKALKTLSKKELIWTVYFFFNYFLKGQVKFASGIHSSHQSGSMQDRFRGHKGQDLMEQLYRYYFEIYLPGLLVIEDKISMKHSLESRVPLLSERVVHWGMKQSNEERLKGGQLKSLLRRIAEPYLPKELLRAPKRGFPTPLRQWFRGDLKNFVKDRLLDSNPFLDEICSLKEREKLVLGHISRAKPVTFDEVRAHKIWMLLSLGSWAKTFKVGNIND